MVDYEAIGKRIKEERKQFRKISQERMAEDLGMYQADISNLEKAKKGSGISDLDKLDYIAAYFDIPLERLLFGRNKEEKMERYLGKSGVLHHLTEPSISEAHRKVLMQLMGIEPQDDQVTIFEAGSYRIYLAIELQTAFDSDSQVIDDQMVAGYVLHRPHYYLFFEDECVAAMTTSQVVLMDLIFRPSLERLSTIIHPPVLDVMDVWRTVNPFVPLMYFAETEQEEVEMERKTLARMDELRQFSDSPVIFIESIYVREECRRLGLCHLFMDILEYIYGDCTMWLNMEPTAGEELYSEYSQYPIYTASEVGQLSMNASIAERLGFTVDPDCWHRNVEKIDSNESISLETVLVRKCAYRIANCLLPIIANDGDLVAVGRAKQKINQAGQTPGNTMDVFFDAEGNMVMMVDGKRIN